MAWQMIVHRGSGVYECNLVPAGGDWVDPITKIYCLTQVRMLDPALCVASSPVPPDPVARSPTRLMSCTTYYIAERQ